MCRIRLRCAFRAMRTTASPRHTPKLWEARLWAMITPSSNYAQSWRSSKRSLNRSIRFKMLMGSVWVTFFFLSLFCLFSFVCLFVCLFSFLFSFLCFLVFDETWEHIIVDTGHKPRVAGSMCENVVSPKDKGTDRHIFATITRRHCEGFWLRKWCSRRS